MTEPDQGAADGDDLDEPADLRPKHLQFKLPWNYILLDPMDMIGITDVPRPVEGARSHRLDRGRRKDGMLKFTCEEMPGAIATAIVNPNFVPTRDTPNYNSRSRRR